MASLPNETESFPLEAPIDDLRDALRDLKADVKALQARIRKGDGGSVKDASRLMGDIRHWLRLAFEMESVFNDRQQKRTGAVNGYAVDFDHARDQIRCRLDRLRRCGDAPSVSG